MTEQVISSEFSRAPGRWLDAAAHGTTVEILDGYRNRRVRAVLSPPAPAELAKLVEAVAADA